MAEFNLLKYNIDLFMKNRNMKKEIFFQTLLIYQMMKIYKDQNREIIK
jgi:hypothetical protein